MKIVKKTLIYDNKIEVEIKLFGYTKIAKLMGIGRVYLHKIIKEEETISFELYEKLKAILKKERRLYNQLQIKEKKVKKTIDIV